MINTTLSRISATKIEIISTNNTINDDESNGLKNETQTSQSNDAKSTSTSVINSVFDASLSSIPLFMKYFAIHEAVVLACGLIYHVQPDFGVLCLSICPGLCIISIFLHFLVTQLDKSIFFSMKHYSVPITIFLISLSSIIAIYHVNTYLSLLVPTNPSKISSSSTHSFFHDALQFPRRHSLRKHLKKEVDETSQSFNYRITFVGSIIAPIVEESFKYLLLALSFPISCIWSFARRTTITTSTRSTHKSYLNYCIQSLFVIFIGLCGGCGIATMENIGYLAACQWKSTSSYCLPNRNFNILGAGLARGIFSVPFHCVTAAVMADIICIWMNTNFSLFNSNKILYVIKWILSYPISIAIPVFLHSSFNFWMKDVPFMTGLVTISGFAFIAFRIGQKQLYITENFKQEMDGNDSDESLNESLEEPRYVIL